MNESEMQLRNQLRNNMRLMQRIDSQARQTQIYAGSAASIPDNTSTIVNQTAHGFTVGQALKTTGVNTYALAKADTASNAQVVGIVGYVYSVDSFLLITEGYIDIPSLSAGTRYYLSATTAGGHTNVAPVNSVCLFDAITNSGAIVKISSLQSLTFASTYPVTSLTSGTSYTLVGNYRVLRLVLIGGGGDYGADNTGGTSIFAAVSSGGTTTHQMTQYSYGGGGGGGGCLVLDIDSSSLSSFSYSIGAAGSGSDGGDTSVTLSSIVYTAKGGSQGQDATAGYAGIGGYGGEAYSYAGFIDSIGIRGTDGIAGTSGLYIPAIGGIYARKGRGGKCIYGGPSSVGNTYGRGAGWDSGAIQGCIHVIRLLA